MIETAQNAKVKMFDSISHHFKIAMVALVFFLALFRFVDIFYLPVFNPAIDLISDKIILTIVLFVIVYLWIQETRDYHNLLKLNKSLEVSHEQLKEAEIESIAALIKAEEAKDSYTTGHSERVTNIAIALAEEMKLGDDFKQEKLTEDEWEIIKSHSVKGAAILKPLKFLTPEINMILHHHERYDGKGYPYGLKGEEIPLGALIMAVADTFDAMNSERPYRKPLSRELIIGELKKGRNLQHKPEITDTFLKLIEENPEFWNR